MDLSEHLNKALLVQGAVTAIIAYWILWIIYTRYLHPLAKFPGPFWASVSRIWTVLHVLPGDAEKTQMKLHAKYGLIRPSTIVSTDLTVTRRTRGSHRPKRADYQ
jgi:hypothetical protein